MLFGTRRQCRLEGEVEDVLVGRWLWPYSLSFFAMASFAREHPKGRELPKALLDDLSR